jgi:hypothetical protein
MTNWRKATYSSGSQACIEVGNAPGRVEIRDAKDRANGPVLRVTPGDWHRFTASIKR